jgi:hypothetical protein
MHYKESLGEINYLFSTEERFNVSKIIIGVCGSEHIVAGVVRAAGDGVRVVKVVKGEGGDILRLSIEGES